MAAEFQDVFTVPGRQNRNNRFVRWIDHKRPTFNGALTKTQNMSGFYASSAVVGETC